MIRKGTIGILVLAACITITSGGCGKNSPTTPPPPPVTKVKILTTVSATYVFSGTTATGTVTFQPASGTAVVGSLDAQSELGEIDKGTTKSFTITIEAAGALKRVFKNVALKGTQKLTTTVLELAGFDISSYCNYFLEQCGDASSGWMNMIWNQPNMTVYFNPDPTTGDRLSQDFITATETAINEIKGYSKGFIQSVSFVENGNKPDDATVTPDGEIWVYNTTRLIGVHNGNYPVGGDVVKASKLWYNMSSSTSVQVRKEVMDAFIQNNQNTFIDAPLPKHWEFSLYWRPKGNAYSYRIFLDREEQEGFDGTVQQLSSVSAESGSSTALLTGQPVTGASKSIDTDGSGGEKKRLRH